MLGWAGEMSWHWREGRSLLAVMGLDHREEPKTSSSDGLGWVSQC